MINDNLEKQAQAIFKSWFVDFEPFQDGEFVDSELGMIPKGWKVDTIGHVSKIIRGASPRPIQEYLSDEGMPWVKISDATSSSSKYLIKTNQFIKEEGVAKSRIVTSDTLILSNSATPGMPMIMAITACVHDGWLIFNEYEDITKEFLYYYLLRERDSIVGLSNGSVFRNLKTDILKSYKIVIPSSEVISKITSIYKDLNSIIKNNMLEICALEELRDSLLPKLMSGELSVEDI
jgi:type I restriction enzyme S subunit